MGSQQGKLLKTLFKIPIIFFTDCLTFKKRKKGEVLCMLFQITHTYFNEPDYVTLHSVMNKMAKNGAKITKNGVTMVFSY